MTSGSDGEYVEHDLGAEHALLHTRFALSAGTATGGVVVLCTGLDGTGTEVFKISYTPSTGAITVTLATGDTLTATAATDLLWHAVELKIDSAGGEAELWLDGVSADTASGSFGSLKVRRVWLGVIFKDAAVTGNLYLDEWVIADSYAGVVTVPQTTGLPNDPKRWLVLHNSAEWAEWYRALRGVPYANLLAVTGGEGDYTTTKAAISAYLSLNGLDSQVIGILVGYGVTGWVTVSSVNYPLSSLLADLSDDTIDLENPYHVSGVTDVGGLPGRSTLTDGRRRLVSEINHQTLGGAKALSTDADGVATVGACGDVLSVHTVADTMVAIGDGWADLSAWWGTITRQQVRLITREQMLFAGHGNAVEFLDDTNFAVNTVGQTPSLVVVIEDDAAGSITNFGDVFVILMNTGYPYLMGPIGAYSASQYPNPAPMVAAFRAGWTWAEAAAVSVPQVNSLHRVIGDPFGVLALPKQGFEVRSSVDGELVLIFPQWLDGEVVPAILTGLLAEGRWALEVTRQDEYGNSSEPARIIVDIGSDGVPVANLVIPRVIRATAVAAGNVELEWHGINDGTLVEPAEYEITEASDLGTVLTTVTAGGLVHFTESVGPFSHGSTVRLAVRASDGASLFGLWVFAEPVVADSVGPPAPTILGAC